MGNQDSIPDKFQELWKYILNRIRFQYHFIRNTGQIRDLKRDRTLRIDKRTEPVHDLSVYNFHCPDLNDLKRESTVRMFSSIRILVPFQVKYNIVHGFSVLLSDCSAAS